MLAQIRNETNSMLDTLALSQFVDQPFQTTLRGRVTLDGVGLHSGRFVELAICPAPADTGIKFLRVDIDAKLQTVEARKICQTIASVYTNC